MDFNYRKLQVYSYSLDLVKKIYVIANNLPKEEQFALSDQLRRAAVSVPSNIVEGTGRGTNKDKAHFMSLAYGSLMEVMCQIEIAYSVKYITEEEFRNIENSVDTVAKLLSGLRNSFLRSNDLQQNINKQENPKVPQPSTLNAQQ